MAAWGEPTKARKAAQQQAVRSPFKARSGEEVNPQVDQTSTQESDTVEFQAEFHVNPVAGCSRPTLSILNDRDLPK